METLHLETVLMAALLVGIRVASLMFCAPFFCSDAFPPQLKAALTLALTTLLYPVYGSLQLPQNTSDWMTVAIGEVVVGLLLGLSVQIVIEAAQVGGQLVGVQAGYSLVTLFDPQTQADTPVMSTFNQVISLLIFLQFNVHHWLLRGVAASFSYLPPGRVIANLRATSTLLKSAGSIWLVGFEMAAPVVMATMMVDITLGFLSKAAPQLPVLFVGISLKTALALAILAGTLVFWPQFFEREFAEGISLGERLLHLAH